MKKFIVLMVFSTCFITLISAQQANYDVTIGVGNGLRFWQNDWFKVHMGIGAEYQYGPVTDYAIKMNMTADAGRGWVWGVAGQAPVAALSNLGHMQIAGKLTTMGNVALASGAKVAFNNVDATSAYGEGITWYNPDPLNYGIFRMPGAWAAPDYQQLKLQFITGIVLDPGASYGKSYVDIQGGGLRVSAGNVGIGTLAPLAKLHVSNGDLLLQNQASGYPSLWLKDVAGTNTLKLDYNSIIGAGSNLVVRSGSNSIVLNDVGGNVGIGTANPNQKLTVNGTIYGTRVKVDLTVTGPDYVFEKDYDLPSLEEIKDYIDENKHLPEVPSAKEMESNGINVGEMNMLLLKKIEELTLYMIEADKKMEKQQKQIEELMQAVKKN